MGKSESRKVSEAGEVFAVKQSNVSGGLVFVLKMVSWLMYQRTLVRKGNMNPVGMVLVRYDDEYLSLLPKNVA